MTSDAQAKLQRALAVGTVFKPATPIGDVDLFTGRIDQVRAVVDVIGQRGQHAVIFGERGVGKTSLANILASRLTSGAQPILAPRINCDATDGFTSIWKKVFSQVDLIEKRRVPGFQYTLSKETAPASDSVGEAVTPDEIRRMLTMMGDNQIVVIILDEFDRLTDAGARRAVADTIKSLADHDVSATVIVVGVADTVGDLITEHQSIQRNLVQIPMPRMSEAELAEIIKNGVTRLGMEIVPDALHQISKLSQGLPHYAHLLGLHATRHAIDSDSDVVTLENLRASIEKSVSNAQQSLQAGYQKAISSPQPDNIYKQVLLACALAPADEFGYFPAADVSGPLSGIMGRQYAIPSYARHLSDFSHPNRGDVLKKIGDKYRFRYRFNDPLMQPFVIMKGLVDHLIDETKIGESSS